MTENTEKTVTFKEAWWKNPPMPGQSESELEWGYRIEYSDGSHEYDFENTPTQEEIDARKRCRFQDPGPSIEL